MAGGPSGRRSDAAGVALACAVAPVLGIATVLLVVADGRLDPDATGLAVSGTVSLGAAGYGLLTRPLRLRATTRGDGLWRTLGLLAIASWGLSALVLSTEGGVQGWPQSAVGDRFSDVAVLLAGIGTLSVPRLAGMARPLARLALEAVVLAMAASLCLWWTVLAPGLDLSAGLPPVAPRGIVSVVGGTMITAMLLLLWLRDRRTALLPALLGTVGETAAATWILLASVPDRHIPWGTSLLGLVSMPAIVVTMLTYRPPTWADTDPEELSRHEAVTGYVTTLLVVALLVVGLVADPTPGAEVVSTVLSCILVGGLGIREVLATGMRRRMTDDLRRQARADPLTGLANRRALTAAIARLPPGAPAVVLTLDLDGFKRVNDLLGHAAGDDLLVRVADALIRTAPAGAVVARLGGDEFAVLVEGGLDDGEQLAGRLRVAVTQVIHAASGLGLAVSVGVGRLVPGDLPVRERRSSRDRLDGLAESAAALRAAKRGGRNRVVVHDGELATARSRRLVLERRLHRAVDLHRVGVVAQPIVDLRSGAVVGFETLARWTDEELGPVAPDEFIAVAEETGLIEPLGRHVLRAALGQSGALRVPQRGAYVGVNASPVQLRSPGFVEIVERELAAQALPARCLVLEVTEALLVDATDPAVLSLHALADLGVRLSIDDYGTGYSSLGYLLRLPVHALKVDRSLTVASLDEPRVEAVVESVLDVAHRLDLTVVMEGIESAELAEHCRRLGAGTGQGWHLGRPVPWPQAAALLDAGVGAVRSVAGPPRRESVRRPSR